jgi:hemolysin activation/secretion protein
MTVEARLKLPKMTERLPGQLQLVGFADTGTVSLNQNYWAIGQNNRTLSGAGVGINWVNYNDFVVKLAYAFKLGSEQANSAPDESGRFWVQAVKYF